MRFWRRIGRLLPSARRSGESSGEGQQGKPRLYAYLDPQTALTTLHDGQLIFVDPADEQLSPSIIAYGIWESWIENVVRRLVRPGDRVIEVGANVGYYTLIIGSLIGPTGRLDAFEANPRIARLLKRSITCSGRSDFVKVHEQIVADRPGTMKLYTSERFGGAGNLVENGWNIDGVGAWVESEAVRLDDMFDGQTIDFIRMDTEGAEVLILNGAMGLLKRSPNIKLCTEWSLGMMSLRGDVPRLVGALSDMQFRYWRVDPSGLTPLAPEQLLAEPHCEVLIARSLD
jgi:FkbM family methyltransferase